MFETVNSFFFFLRYAVTGIDYFTSGTFQYKNQIKYQGNTFMHHFYIPFSLLPSPSHMYTIYFKFN